MAINFYYDVIKDCGRSIPNGITSYSDNRPRLGPIPFATETV